MSLTGAQQLALTLAKHAVTTVFTVPGGHCLPLLAALEELGIHTIGARHEQGAGFMAEAWARVTSTPGVVVTTAGPGVINVLTPLAQAHAESVPICVLALDNYSSTLSDAEGQFHGITDMRSAVSPFADWVGCATGPDDACQLVQAAFARLARGRPRPVLIQLPSDTLTAAYPDQVPEGTPSAQQDEAGNLDASDLDASDLDAADL